jgi:ABC-type uncharacterized transport system auxiliary subunit
MLNNVIKASFVAILVTGCSVFMPVSTPDIHSYQLGAMSHDNLQAQCTNNTSNTVLQITHVRADAPYDTINMFYSTEQYELDSYVTHQWVSLPSGMLTQLIQQKLIQSCTYANVVNADFMTVAKYRLTTQIINLKQTINGTNSTFTLTAVSQLVDNKTNQVLKGKTFDIIVPTTPDPQGYIKGANLAANQFLEQLLVWLKS